MTTRVQLVGGLIAAMGLLCGCGRPAATRLAAPAAADGPVRVVSLAPNLTEIVCAIGGEDLLVGRSSACDYPPSVSNVLCVGGFGTPSLEVLASCEPTIVLETDLADESISPVMDRMGLHHERLSCETIEGILTSIARIGELIGHEPEATRLIDKLTAGIEASRAALPPPDERPSVYVEIWNDPPVTAGKGSFLSELVALAGGRNIGDAIDRDYFNVSAEWIVEQNPDIVLAVYMDTAENSREQFTRRPGWGALAAVTNGAIYPGGNSDVLLRPGPRLLQGLEAIRACIANAR